MVYRVIIGIPRWHFTGPAVFAQRLVRSLISEGHDAHILLTESGCNHIQESWIESEVPSDLPCARLPVAGDDTWAQRWEALERYLEERAPCFYIMLHDWRNNVIAYRLSNRIRLIGLVQADSELELGQAARLGQHWDAIIGVSENLHFKLLSRLPHLAPKIHTICNAVPSLNQLPLKAQNGPLQLVYSGELRAHQKRLDDMAEVALRLAERGVSFRLTFYGEGSYRPILEDKLGKLIKEGTVALPGRLTGDDLLEALEDQHVFLLTSEYEGLSIAMLEAMSRGCVPVVSRLASQSSVIRSGINSLTASIGDIDGFVQHIQTLASNRTLLANLSVAAFESIRDGGYRVEDMLKSYLNLFRTTSELAAKDRHKRDRYDMPPPPQQVGKVLVLPGNYDSDLAEVNRLAMWPDKPKFKQSIRAKVQPVQLHPLDSYKIFVSASTEYISGVDVFAVQLVRGLRQRGFNACILTSNAASAEKSLLDLTDLPVEVVETPSYLGWPERWRSLIQKLSDCGPCIYIPNYDYANSCIAPRLPAHVRVVGIGHSDDPTHYEHLCRIGHACDAIVGVSTAITRHLSQLIPELSSKLSTIPYGVPAQQSSGNHQSLAQRRGISEELRIVFTGRLVRSQKRAEDVIAIAKELYRRDIPYEMVVIGDGELRSTMERAAGKLIMERKIWFTGAQPNAVTLNFLESCDIFLLPSSFEGLSISMLEAMSRAVVPVVSSVRSGVPDVISDGENGLVAPVADIQSFADRIEWLAANRSELQRIAGAAAETIQQSYLSDHMIDCYVELFKQAIGRQTVRMPGPIAPPYYIAQELRLSSWVRRVAADPLASFRRVSRRLSSR